MPPETNLAPGQVHDVNAYTLSALVETAGGIPSRYGILHDEFQPMYSAVERALSESDLVVITAGSSASRARPDRSSD